MRVVACALVIVLVLSPRAIAEPASHADGAKCKAQESTLERDIEVARSKGQMLRRQQLADALVALQDHCDPGAQGSGRAEDIEKLEREIKDLRKAMERAEEELRKLKTGD